MGLRFRNVSMVAVLTAVAGASGVRSAAASDLGPATGQHVGKVIAWDTARDRLVLVGDEKDKWPRRITLWTDPQTTVTATRSGPKDVFGHGKGRGRLTLGDLKAGDRVQVEWRRAGRRHVAVSVRRLP